MADIASFGRGETGAAGTDGEGFQASLKGAALADLVQLECLARSEGSFRVVSEGRIGYLFFQNGKLTHALLDDLIGEEAALQILDWSGGTFEPCRVAWPETPSITRNWQSLLLGVARARDDARRRPVAVAPKAPRAESGQRLRTLPPPKPARAFPAPAAAGHGAPTSGAPSELPVKSTPPRAPDGGVRAFVRLDGRGRVVSARGNPEELVQVASYASRLGNLIGDALGMTEFAGLEAVCGDERYVLATDAAGGLFAFSASFDADLGGIPERFEP